MQKSIMLLVFLFSLSVFANEKYFAGSWEGTGEVQFGSDPKAKCDSFTFDLKQDEYFGIEGIAYCDGSTDYWSYYLKIKGEDLVLEAKDAKDGIVVGKLIANNANFRVSGKDGTDWIVNMKVEDGVLYYSEDLTRSSGVRSTLTGVLNKRQ